MGSDDGIILVRSRLFRAILTCTTCRATVFVGDPAEHEPLAAYLLGFTDGQRLIGAAHVGTCAGGALDVAIEELPDPTGSPPPAPPAGGSSARLELVK